MTTTINGTTGVSLIQDGAIVQADLGANVAGNGPAFSAYQSIATNMPTATLTKINFQVKEFDTSSAFDATTNSRFQPLVAGYYMVNGCVSVTGALYASVSKNGTEVKRGAQASTANVSASVSTLVYLNGSTDYVELFVYQASGTSQTTNSPATLTYFQGFLVRAA